MDRVTETQRAVQVEPDDVRAGMQLANAMIHATTHRNTAYANQTVLDFFSALFRLGVRLEDRLGSIEYGISQCPSGHVCVERDEQGRIEVREVRR